MNFRLLAKMVGLLLTLESVAMLACGVFAWFDYVDASHAAVTPMFTAAGLTFIAGILLVIFGMGKYERIPRREGVVIVSEVFGRKGPAYRYRTAFREPIHDGLEFEMVELRDGWMYIRLADGRTCWVPEGQVQLVFVE